MKTKSSREFLTHAIWFRKVIDENVILCHTSALEMLEMYDGFIEEETIDVYALQKGKYDNIVYHIVDAFDNIPSETVLGVRCASFEYTVNDMLRNLSKSDRCALTEALSNYYAQHNDTFDGLNIYSENRTAFNEIAKDIFGYYNGGY